MKKKKKMDRLTAEYIVALIATAHSEGFLDGDKIFLEKLKSGELAEVEISLLQTIKELYPDIAARYSYLSPIFTN